MRNSLTSIDNQFKMNRSMSFSAIDSTDFRQGLQQTLKDKAEQLKKINLSEDDDPEEDYNQENEEEADMYSAEGETVFTNDERISKKPTEFLDNFTAMYGGPMKVNAKARCVIMPSAKWKLVWDMWVVFLLLTVSLIVPYRLAFDPSDSPFWIAVYYGIDANFVMDAILTFFTATIDPKTQVVQTDKKIIAKQYFSFWFWIDMISVMPLDAF